MQWWQKAVFYQIYPRSFGDANGDGIGDIRGITQKLDYLKWLGIDAIWLSPHYPSPQVDVGYDVADYLNVNPEYGTLDDFREFLEQAHQRDIRLIIDFVLNHTSDKHDWFIESKSSRDNPKRDWYIWHDGKDGNPPNNWESTFGGSAWEYDETTGQYYYHYFLKEQPDLNWRNPEVYQAMFDAMRFWFDMGVDGLRLDAIGTLYEDPDLPDHDSPYTAFDVLRVFWLGKELDEERRKNSDAIFDLFKYQRDLPEVYAVMRDLRKMANEYEGRFLVGETNKIEFLGTGSDQLHSIFNFDLLKENHLNPELIRMSQKRWFSTAPKCAWQANTLNNHDQSRVMTHYGAGKNDLALAKLAATLVLTLEGTPFLYYGEEIGMTDYAVKSYDEVRDMVSGVYRVLALAEGRTEEEIVKDLGTFSRDRCRTPMQWDNSPNAGFSPEGIKTWLPVHENYRQGVNVAEQEKDESSLLYFYRNLLSLRKANSALISGKYRVVDEAQNEYLAYLREGDSQTVLILLNFGDKPTTVNYSAKSAQALFSSEGRTGTISTSGLQLAAFEILILNLQAE